MLRHHEEIHPTATLRICFRLDGYVVVLLLVGLLLLLLLLLPWLEWPPCSDGCACIKSQSHTWILGLKV